MVDTHRNATALTSLQSSVISTLQQLLDQQITTRQLVQLAEEQHWELLEGQHESDRSTRANHLREILSDMIAQWESRAPESLEEFPAEWIHHWLNQLQIDSSIPMTQSPKKPTHLPH